MINPDFLVIDLFCGAGGVTTGFVQAEVLGRKVAKVIACVNHDPKAIESHSYNHPDVLHFEEDIRTLDLTDLVTCAAHWQEQYPNAKLILWASLECTNFSKAKGGQPRDADSRTLANDLFRYIDELQPDLIMIENVEEFMSWGPLGNDGKPLSRKNGIDYLRWTGRVCDKGYRYDWRLLNSADFGAYTSRTRFFGIFAKDGMPIVFPEATHAKVPQFTMFYSQQKWKPVREVLDLSDEGKSILNREKPLSDKTLERIYAGLVKYVGSNNNKFMHTYYGKGSANDLECSCPTIPTKDRIALVSVQWLDKQYSGSDNHQSIDSPAGTLTGNPPFALMDAKFLMPTNFNNKPKSMDEPCQVITANRKHHYLVNPSWGGNPSSIDKPHPVIIARQDKAPMYLVATESGQLSIQVFETDSESMVKIKQFMAAYGIIDIKMRMLKVSELIKIQGFPHDYKLAGNQTDMKKFIGNSVVPHVVKAWAESLSEKLNYNSQLQSA